MSGPGAIHGELETGMMRHFVQGTLGYVGFAVHRPFAAYHIPYVDGAARQEMLDGLCACVSDLDDRPLLPMPDLNAYDATFAPTGVWP